MAVPRFRDARTSEGEREQGNECDRNNALQLDVTSYLLHDGMLTQHSTWCVSYVIFILLPPACWICRTARRGLPDCGGAVAAIEKSPTCWMESSTQGTSPVFPERA